MGCGGMLGLRAFPDRFAGRLRLPGHAIRL